MNPPTIYRAYHKPTGKFVQGVLGTDNKFLVGSVLGVLELTDVHIDFFTGKVAESGQPVYQNDIVELSTPNEFGSFFIDKGVVRYDPTNMCFTIVSEHIKEPGRMPTNILQVIGNNHD